MNFTYIIWGGIFTKIVNNGFLNSDQCFILLFSVLFLYYFIVFMLTQPTESFVDFLSHGLLIFCLVLFMTITLSGVINYFKHSELIVLSVLLSILVIHAILFLIYINNVEEKK